MNALSTYVRDVFDMFFTVCGSMAMGLRTLSRPNVTTEYPRKDKWDVPDGSRMKLYNNIDDCIGCYKCSRICPTDCIEIETIKAPDSVDLGKASTGNPLNFWVPTFDIDMVKCCYCDLCTTVCPTECLVMTKAFEGSAYDRGNLIYHFGNVDSEEMEEINQILAEEEGGDATTATAGASDTDSGTADSEAVEESGIMGRLLPDSLEGLPVKERVKARLIARGKIDEDLPEGVEIDESASPAGSSSGGTTTTTPAADEETVDQSDSDTEATPSEEEPQKKEKSETESSVEETDTSEGSSDESGYQRDPEQDLRDRIKNRLEARGKL